MTILNASSHAQVGTLTGFVANPDTVRPFGDTAPTPPPPPPPVRVTTTSLPVATRNVFYNTQLGSHQRCRAVYLDAHRAVRCRPV